jgi:hypothetical protein
MKKLILSLMAMASLTMAAIPAVANLGDTYEQSCLRYGGEGKIYSKSNKVIRWHYGRKTIFETFVKNECVAMKYVADKGYQYTIDRIRENILPHQKGYNQEWTGNGGGGEWVANWATTDGLILAGLNVDGSFEVAYAQYLKAKGLLLPPINYGSAPVEDTLEDNVDSKTAL